LQESPLSPHHLRRDRHQATTWTRLPAVLRVQYRCDGDQPSPDQARSLLRSGSLATATLVRLGGTACGLHRAPQKAGNLDPPSPVATPLRPYYCAPTTAYTCSSAGSITGSPSRHRPGQRTGRRHGPAGPPHPRYPSSGTVVTSSTTCGRCQPVLPPAIAEKLTPVVPAGPGALPYIPQAALSPKLPGDLPGGFVVVQP